MTGSVAKIVSPIRRSTIPHPPWDAYWISTKKSAPRARLRKNRNETSHEKRNCFGFAAPRTAQTTAPSRAQAAPMTGARFHECPGGIVACSGRSATRSRSGIIQDSRSSTLRAPSDSSSLPVADGSNRGSHDSIEMKKASSVTCSKTLDWKSGW